MERQKIAVVFPGQGTQWNGMGKDFFDRFAEARAVYEQASEALGWDVAAMCFGDDTRLHLTEFAQPCILATEIAMFKSLENILALEPACFAGHSLGEYTALAAAGVIMFEDALKIVHARGKLMQAACPEGSGAMAAVICEDATPERFRPIIEDLEVDIANINSKEQLVISGQSSDIDTAAARMESAAGFPAPVRFVKLQVSAAFHSRFMAEAAESFSHVLDGFLPRFDPSRAPLVTSNFTGGFHSSDAKKIKNALVFQLFSPVRWRQNMEALSTRAQSVIELGPARPLGRFLSSCGLECLSLTSVKSMERRLAQALVPAGAQKQGGKDAL